jgi:hypothetical protein
LGLVSLPVPRQQLVDPLGRIIGDAGEDVGESCPRIDIVELAGFDQRVDGGRAVPPASELQIRAFAANNQNTGIASGNPLECAGQFGAHIEINPVARRMVEGNASNCSIEFSADQRHNYLVSAGVR